MMNRTATAEEKAAIGLNYFKIRNYEKAYAYLSAAARLGYREHASVYLSLGNFFFKSDKEGDANRAMDCFNIAADQGSTQAYLSIGHLFYRKYRESHKLEDLEDSFNAFAKAYSLGNYEGAYRVGLLMMHDAMQSPKVREIAVEWFQEALRGKWYGAYSAIGRLYAESPFSEPCDEKDDKIAVHWFLRGCLFNDPGSFYYSGLYILRGIAVPQDVQKGILLLKKAADMKYAPAALFLGQIYDRGRFVTRNITEALRYYEKAARLGMKSGNTYIGLCAYKEGISWLGYGQGKNFRKDPAKAAHYLEIADAHGNELADEELGMLYAEGFGKTKPDPEKALAYLDKARKAGLSTADGKYIGVCLKEGANLAKKLDKACRKLESAGKGTKIWNECRKLAKKIIYYYKLAGDAGSVDAWALRCEMFLLFGFLLPGNEKDFLRSTENGKGSTLIDTDESLWKYYSGKGEKGDFHREDPKKSFDLALKLAKKGRTEFFGILALYYKIGYGTAKNLEKAREWEQKTQTRRKADAADRF